MHTFCDRLLQVPLLLIIAVPQVSCEIDVTKPSKVLRGHSERVMSVSWSPDGKRLASASFDGTVRIWDVATGMEQRVLRGHSRYVFCVAWSPNGNRLASSSTDSVRLWDPDTGREVHMVKNDPIELPGWPGQFATSGNVCVVWSPDGQHLAVRGLNDGTTRILGGATSEQRMVLPASQSVAWSPDGKRLALANAVGGNGNVRLWDTAMWKEEAVLRLPTTVGIITVSWSPDGNRLASFRLLDTEVWVWDIGTRTVERALYHTTEFETIAWSPDGKHFAAATGGGEIRLWNVVTWTEDQLSRYATVVEEMAWSPDGKYLALAVTRASNGDVHVWDAASKKRVSVLRNHTGPIISLAWSPDGRCLATGSWDSTVRVWDLTTK